MKQLLLCGLLGLACIPLNGAQARAAVQPHQQTVFASITPSALYPIVGAALMTFGLTPNSKFPTRFRASEEIQWIVLFAGSIVLVWYLRKLANHIERLENRIQNLKGENSGLRTLLNETFLKLIPQSNEPTKSASSPSSMSSFSVDQAHSI